MIAAGIESLLIFLVFIVVSGLSTWLQRRRQGEAEDQSEWLPPGDTTPRRPTGPATSRTPTTPPREPTPSPLQNWEEELRRLLQGDRHETAEPAPRPAPPPLPSTPTALPGPTRVEGLLSGRLNESQEAYRRAQELQADAAEQLRQARAKTSHRLAGSKRTQAVRPGDDIAAARALLSRPRLARRAVIASVILGTPKGLE